MDQRLFKAARLGDVAALNKLLEEDPQILEKLSLSPSAENPLHIAALAGKTDFAKEMIRMMPSFAQELNQDGYSPMHMVSARGNVEIVGELLTLGGDLCLVRDKDGRTPLHYAAMKGRVNVIKELLFQCPKAIEEVTARGETALHVAVKYYQFEALRVLVERFENMDNQYWELIDAKDKEDKTILELAISTKQHQVVEFLHEKGVGTLQGEQQIVEEANTMAEASPPNLERQPDESAQNAILVAASLIATVTYTAGLSPPPTIWKEGMKLDPNCIFHPISRTSTSIRSSLLAPTNTCPAFSFYMFMSLNSAGFFSSIVVMLLFGVGPGLRLLLLAPLSFMMLSYLSLALTMSPDGLSILVIFMITIFFLGVFLCYCAWLYRKSLGQLLSKFRQLLGECFSYATRTTSETTAAVWKKKTPGEDVP
ncbi:hypothetical protein L1049_015687 [Liquidambar formosana]|uniref:PGG domain-containing protein n=1 Tax=Liquidambar formosana TaxID=63359 RepID=A0AAP0WZY8_LIQFO